MKVVYIAHPLGSGPDREANRKNAARWAAWVAKHCNVAPVCDWIVLSGEWDEAAENRERGLAIDVALVKRCDEVWLVGGRVSPGMAIEAAAARAAGIPVVDKTAWGGVPPGTLCADEDRDGERYACRAFEGSLWKDCATCRPNGGPIPEGGAPALPPSDPVKGEE